MIVSIRYEKIRAKKNIMFVTEADNSYIYTSTSSITSWPVFSFIPWTSVKSQRFFNRRFLPRENV